MASTQGTLLIQLCALSTLCLTQFGSTSRTMLRLSITHLKKPRSMIVKDVYETWVQSESSIINLTNYSLRWAIFETLLITIVAFWSIYYHRGWKANSSIRIFYLSIKQWLKILTIRWESQVHFEGPITTRFSGPNPNEIQDLGTVLSIWHHQVETSKKLCLPQQGLRICRKK